MIQSYRTTSKRKEYLRKYQREWVKRRREAFLKDKECEDCGSKERLELDHIWPEQKVSNRIWSWSEERRLKEIAKCQILCRPCHLAKTRVQNRCNEHGATSYRKGCRCEICLIASRDQKRKYRAKGKNL